MALTLPAPQLPGIIQISGAEFEVIDKPGYLTVSTVMWGPLEVLKLHTTPQTWERIADYVAADETRVRELISAGVGLICRLAGENVSIRAWRRVAHTTAAITGDGMQGWARPAATGIDIHTAPAWSIYASATATITKNLTSEARQEWESQLERPLPSEDLLIGIVDDTTTATTPQRPPQWKINQHNAKAIQQLQAMS